MAMTIKEQLHQIVDQLDDEHAADVLPFAMRVSSHGAVTSTDRPHTLAPGVDVDRETLWQIARPLSIDDPISEIFGMIDDDGPTDVASNKHRYLAATYGDLHDK